jgi:hypothetical protein
MLPLIDGKPACTPLINHANDIIQAGIDSYVGGGGCRWG